MGWPLALAQNSVGANTRKTRTFVNVLNDFSLKALALEAADRFG
jgi:hypothetical protein